MILPSYWMTRPDPDPDDAVRAAFDRLLDEASARDDGDWIDYQLDAPKWQFLCHAAEQRRLALHGSGNPGISEFEPRQPIDLGEFGNQKAVYAAADGIWAMFFAIVDRDGYEMSLSNACIRVVEAGTVSEPYYMFSISAKALHFNPWRKGVVYLLPHERFIEQPVFTFNGLEVRVAQLASLEPVKPVAKLAVEPGDFPFLAQIRGHDDLRLEELSQTIQTGQPWPEGMDTE